MTSYMMTSYDLYGGHRPAVALDSLSYAFESSQMARFIMYVENNVKIHNIEHLQQMGRDMNL